MNDTECYNNFIRFLKDNNIYKSFFVAFNSEQGRRYRESWNEKASLKEFILYCRDYEGFNHYKKYKKYYDLNKIVLNFAFDWEETKEGYDFWQNIYMGEIK